MISEATWLYTLPRSPINITLSVPDSCCMARIRGAVWRAVCSRSQRPAIVVARASACRTSANNLFVLMGLKYCRKSGAELRGADPVYAAMQQSNIPAGSRDTRAAAATTYGPAPDGLCFVSPPGSAWSRRPLPTAVATMRARRCRCRSRVLPSGRRTVACPGTGRASTGGRTANGGEVFDTNSVDDGASHAAVRHRSASHRPDQRSQRRAARERSRSLLRGRIADLSHAAAARLGFVDDGVTLSPGSR